MKAHADVLVIGGGVIGLTTAYFLAREGVRVGVLERGEFGREASWAGAGILPPGHPERAASPFDRLRAHSAALFPELSRELRELTGIDNGYLRSGGLEFADRSGLAAEHEWRGAGIAFEPVAAGELHRVEPAVAPGLGPAYHLPGMAQLRNPRHLQALVAACGLRGVTLRPGCPAQGLTVDRGRVRGVVTPDGTLAAGAYVLTAGAWTESLLGPLGLKAGIKPVRGQIALLRTDRPLLRKILLWGAQYLVPRPDGRVLVGSTEEDAGFRKRTTAGAIAGLLELAARLVPALADAELEASWAGLRPGSPDGFPVLGRLPAAADLFIAAGHFRAGIQLSPGTALVLKELILGRPPTVPVEDFSIERFGRAPGSN